MIQKDLRNFFIYYALKYYGQILEIYHAILWREKIDKSEISNILSQLEFSTVTIIDDDNPEVFNNNNFVNPPIVLFYNGNLKLVNSDMMKIYVLEDNTRLISAIDLINNKYVICCECYNNIKKYMNIENVVNQIIYN